LKGAAVSVVVGIILATIFVIDQLIGPESGKELFPFLHHKLTPYTYLLMIFCPASYATLNSSIKKTRFL
jgi:hypothetical protein